MGAGGDRAAAVFQLDLENPDPPASPMAHIGAVQDETAQMPVTVHDEKVSNGHRQCVNSGAHEETPENIHTDSKDDLMNSMPQFVFPQTPSHPDELHGSKTDVDADGVKTTTKRDLSRCHKQ